MANLLRSPCDQITTPCVKEAVIPIHCEKWVLVATILGSSMAFIDGTVVNVALPAFQDVFKASVSQIQWVIEAYALSLAALLLVGGTSGDLYGRRRVFLIGVFIFTAASIWCGLATDILQLIIARTIQGIGAALLVPGSLALISASIPDERLGQAIGTWAGFTAITSAVGPVIGGWLVENASWRWIFLMNVPLAIIVYFFTIRYVYESKNESENKKLDILGALLATIGLGAIVFGLIEWESKNSITLVAEVIGISALLVFFFVESHITSPMLPLDIFRSRNFSIANLLTFFLYSALYGILFFFPLDLIQIQGYTATQAGAALLPLILLMFILSRWSGGLVKKFGARPPLVIGPTIAALGFALFLRTGTNDVYWTTFFPATFVLGLGMAISVAPLTTVVMNSIARDYLGTASGINNAVSRIAGLLAIAVFGLVMIMIFNQQLTKNLNASSIPTTLQQEVINQRSQLANIKSDNKDVQLIVKQSFVTGYKTILYIAVGLALASALSAAFLTGGKFESRR